MQSRSSSKSEFPRFSLLSLELFLAMRPVVTTEVVPFVVEFEVAVPRLTPAFW
jgi:hypothetical protein